MKQLQLITMVCVIYVTTSCTTQKVVYRERLEEAKGYALYTCIAHMNKFVDSTSVINKDYSGEYFVQLSSLSLDEIIRIKEYVDKEGDNAYYNLWDANNNTYSTNDNQVVKTIYDPCPVGFKLPASNAFTGFTTTGSNTSNNYPANGIWDSTRNGWNFYAQANRAGQLIFFPASGTRNYIDGKVSLINSDGLYWSTGPHNQSSGWRLNFRPSYVNPLGNYYRSAGYGLRPVQE